MQGSQIALLLAKWTIISFAILPVRDFFNFYFKYSLKILVSISFKYSLKNCAGVTTRGSMFFGVLACQTFLTLTTSSTNLFVNLIQCQLWGFRVGSIERFQCAFDLLLR